MFQKGNEMKKAIDAMTDEERLTVASMIHAFNNVIGATNDEMYDDDLYALMGEVTSIDEYHMVKETCDLIQVRRIANDLDSIIATRFWEDFEDELPSEEPAFWHLFKDAIDLYYNKVNPLTWRDLAAAILSLPESLKDEPVLVDLTAADHDYVVVHGTHLVCPGTEGWEDDCCSVSLDCDASVLYE